MNSSSATLAEVDYTKARASRKAFANLSPNIRSIIARGAVLLLSIVPISTVISLYKNPLFFIKINSDGSGVSVYKYKVLRKPLYSSFNKYTGSITYTAPYVVFSPPLRLENGQKLDKLYIPSSFLLEGGAKSITNFVNRANSIFNTRVNSTH